MNFINWLHSQITCYCRLCQPSLSLQWNVCWRLYIYRLLLKPSFSFIIFSTHVYSVCVIKILLWVHLVAALKQYLHAFTVFDRYIISNTKKHLRQYFIGISKHQELKIRRAAECFWRNSRCFDSRWNTVSSVW